MRRAAALADASVCHGEQLRAPLDGPRLLHESGLANVEIGCFQNRHGEQWGFTCDRATREASLCDGDTSQVSCALAMDGSRG